MSVDEGRKLTASQQKKLDAIAEQDSGAKVVGWSEERKGPIVQSEKRTFVLMPRGMIKVIFS